MDITDDRLQVCLCIHRLTFKTILKQLSYALVFRVVPVHEFTAHLDNTMSTHRTVPCARTKKRFRTKMYAKPLCYSLSCCAQKRRDSF
jgi:hypothetical protein